MRACARAQVHFCVRVCVCVRARMCMCVCARAPLRVYVREENSTSCRFPCKMPQGHLIITASSLPVFIGLLLSVARIRASIVRDARARVCTRVVVGGSAKVAKVRRISHPHFV